MANMRTRYSATVTASATQLKPTQMTARQAACINRNGSTRAQSMRRSASKIAGAGGRVAKSLLPNHRESSVPTRTAVGGSIAISFSGVMGFLALQSRNSLVQRRMAHKQPHDSIRAARVDSKSLQLLRHRLTLTALQHLQRIDHVAGAGKIGAASIGTELAPTRVPANDHARENAQYELRYHGGQEKSDARTLPVVAQNRSIDDAPDDTREKNHECI